MNLSAEEITAAYAAHGSKRAAAIALGVDRTTLRRWLKDIERDGKPRLRVHKIANDAVLPGAYDQNRIQFATCGQNGAQASRCVAVLPDMHEPFADRRAVDTAIDHIFARHSPTDLMLPGDTADLYEFSRFAGTAKALPDNEIHGVVYRLEDLAKTFKDCRKWFLMGNHERRFVRYIQTSAPKLARIFGASVPEIFQLERLGFTFHDNMESWERTGEFFKIGKLNYIHGDELGGCGFVHMAENMAKKYRGNILFGHAHVSDASKPQRDINRQVCKVWGMGCLHTTRPGYRAGANHFLGFAVVEYDADGSGHFTVYNYLLDDNYKVRL